MTKKEKTGLFALGFVENLSTYAEELQKKLVGTTQVVTIDEINKQTTNVEYFNGAGYKQFPNGDPVDANTANTYVLQRLTRQAMRKLFMDGFIDHLLLLYLKGFNGVQKNSLNSCLKRVVLLI